jgi:hypothetical protein
MGKVINLNKFRKKKAKAAADKLADNNRRLHGRSQAERARDELQKKALESRLDGARLVPPDEKPSDE